MTCALGTGNRDGMRVDESGLAAHQLDVMESEILQNARAFHIYNFAFMVHEIVDSEIFLQRVIDAVQAALPQAREIESGFAQSLARNGTGVDATAAHVLGALDSRDALAEIRGLGAALLTSRPAADHDEVERLARSHEVLRRVLTFGPAIRVPEDCRRRGYEGAEVSC